MSSQVSRKLPLLQALRNYNREAFRGDLAAGLSTAVMLVPQGMAYAVLAGLDPIVGLYAATLPTAIYALLGTSRTLAVGPVAMVSLLVAGGVAPLAGPDPVLYAAYAGLLMLLVGVLQLSMGMARLGFLVKYLSHSVIAGFTSAAALIIGFSQFKHILGVPIERSHHIHSIIAQAASHASSIHLLTVGIAFASVVSLLVLKKKAPRFPRFLWVVAAGTLAVWTMGLDSAGVAIVGAVPAGLPAFKLPHFDFAVFGALLPTGLTIALVGFMESIAVAKSFARHDGHPVDANQELRALGAANLGGAFFQAYPVTGGFSRTAVNAEAGAKTGIAGLLTAAAVAMALLFLTPLFFFMPKAVLAAIIVTAVFGLIDVREAKHLWRISRDDFALMAITFFATLGFGIEQGIGIGVASSILWVVIKSAKPHVAVLGRLPESTIYRNMARHPEAIQREGVVALRVDGPLFFANTAFLADTINDLVRASPVDVSAIILDAGAIGSVDASAAAALMELAEGQEAEGKQVWLCSLRGPVRDQLCAAGLLDVIPPQQLVARVQDAMDVVEELA